jgi:cytochrome c556
MIRSMFAVASIAAVALGVSMAVAQQDVIKERKDIMKGNGDQAKIGAGMAKGEQPFDLAAAQKIFATYVDAAAKMPNLFPDNSKTGEDTAALPKVWEDMADFKARFVKFGDDAKAAQGSVKDLDTFKAAFGDIGKNGCGGCHQLDRAKKS